MRLNTIARPLAVLTAVAVLLLGGLACTTQVANGVSSGGGGTGGAGGGAGGHPECSKNADCAGDHAICRKSSGKCVTLTSELCATLESSSKDGWKDDGAVIFGSILPTVGPDQSLGRVQEDAIKLAIGDFGKAGGLPSPGGDGHRPIVLVGCNDGPNEDRSVEAAKHLVDDLGLPAIIGYSFSGTTIELATQVTIPAGVLLFSPSATNPVISTLQDQDLVWRSSPPDTLQARALAGYLPLLEKAIRARYALGPAEPIKVAVVHNNESYGAGIADALVEALSFNGASAPEQLGTNFKRIDYGSPDAPKPGAVAAIVDFAPHLTFLLGYAESVDVILKQVENSWTAPSHRSFFALGDAGEVSSLWDQVISSEDLRTRVTGTVPGANAATYPPYATFTAEWSASVYAADGSADTFGAAGAYDILYLLAYSAVAVGADPLTGKNLVSLGLRSMTPPQGQPVPKEIVGPPGINAAFQKLMARLPIDIEGASGPLDFDKQGEAPSDIQIWCVPKGSGGKAAGPAIASGVYSEATTGAVTGVYPGDCALP